MGRRYETGTKRHVLLNMVEYAIQDRKGFIESYLPVLEFDPDDEETNRVIDEARAEIRDFQRMRKNLQK